MINIFNMILKRRKHAAIQILNKLNKGSAFRLIDVGSMGGVEPEWDLKSPKLQVLGFEPDNREYVKLNQNPQNQFINCALSDSKRPIHLFISREPGRTSKFPPNWEILSQFPDTERYETVTEETIENVSTLDDVLSELNFNDPDFIKLDTQGSELEILRGGRNLLASSLVGIKVEVEFIELYKSQPLFSDIDHYISSNGFFLYDIRRCFWKPKNIPAFLGKGQLIFGDALYFRKLESFFLVLEKMRPEVRRDKILNYLSSCMIYGATDLAWVLIDSAFKHSYLAEDDAHELNQLIMEYCRKRRPLRIPGRRWLYRIFWMGEWRLRASYLGWADADSHLGNL